MTQTIYKVAEVFDARDGLRTIALYDKISALGIHGELAVNILRVVKNSTMAKGYRRGRSTRAAYNTKQWAMMNVVALLQKPEGVALGLTWGWKEDPDQIKHRWILFVDTPVGQVSFHAEHRGSGPDYPGEWDGKAYSTIHAIKWAAQLLDEAGITV